MQFSRYSGADGIRYFGSMSVLIRFAHFQEFTQRLDYEFLLLVIAVLLQLLLLFLFLPLFRDPFLFPRRIDRKAYPKWSQFFPYIGRVQSTNLFPQQIRRWKTIKHGISICQSGKFHWFNTDNGNVTHAGNVTSLSRLHSAVIPKPNRLRLCPASDLFEKFLFEQQHR